MHQWFGSFSCCEKVVLRRIFFPESLYKILVAGFAGETTRQSREKRRIKCVVVLPLALQGSYTSDQSGLLLRVAVAFCLGQRKWSIGFNTKVTGINSVVCVTQNIGLNDGKVISDLQISKFQRMTFFESW